MRLLSWIKSLFNKQETTTFPKEHVWKTVLDSDNTGHRECINCGFSDLSWLNDGHVQHIKTRRAPYSCGDLGIITSLPCPEVTVLHGPQTSFDITYEIADDMTQNISKNPPHS